MSGNWHTARRDHRAHQSESIAETALTILAEHGAPALTMAAVADAAGISRQTLYRYYPDIEAVLAGIAELATSHDDQFEARVLEHAAPGEQLDALVRTVAQAGGHDPQSTAALRAALPPEAREILTRHQTRIVRLLERVLEEGMDSGVFRSELEPSVDAPLVLGLAAAADPRTTERAVALVRQVVYRQPKEELT